MELVVMFTSILVISLYFILKLAYETLSCYWLTPRRIKKIMETKGACGPNPASRRQSWTWRPRHPNPRQDMDSISHDIVGRLLPHYVAWSQSYVIHR
ncbi:UNVERIFIED_CONTAM: Cytokinin hydroxylase [Sesamum latifolium]|uniref:Cytokinin hydroxylase n=1 Tax=Sesamum latifolium TaxID=2727402 RepID=A0AAW2X917_9LAMI